MANSSGWERLAARSAYETAKRVYAKCPPPKPKLFGPEAASYLQQVIPLVQADILNQHRAYGPIRWMWYLRRSPDVLFAGSYGTTLGYDRLLAEVITARSTAVDHSSRVERVAFRVDEASFRHLVRYVVRVKLLSDLHVQYRLVGKGAELDASHPIFTTSLGEATRNAIRIYDERHDRDETFVGAGLGLADVAASAERIVAGARAKEPIAFLTVGVENHPQQVTQPDETGTLGIVTVQARNCFKELLLATILNPLGVNGGLPEYLHSIASLVTLFLLVPAILATTPWAASSIFQQGYVFLGKYRLREIYDSYWPEVIERVSSLTPGYDWQRGFDQWIDALGAVDASAWPLSSGNFVREFGDNFLVDTKGASHALLHRIELGRSPLIGNLRGDAFEVQCQNLIDGTSWSPPPEVKSLRGRTLHAAGLALTDIDSIGAKGRSLLIVSCKSIIYDRDYDQGCYQVIRNAQSTVDKAVERWDEIVAKLKCDPKGDNFDFSEYTEIIGLVCTPFAVYSDAERTLAFVRQNLRVASSMFELKNWLDAN